MWGDALCTNTSADDAVLWSLHITKEAHIDRALMSHKGSSGMGGAWIIQGFELFDAIDALHFDGIK